MLPKSSVTTMTAAVLRVTMLLMTITNLYDVAGDDDDDDNDDDDDDYDDDSMTVCSPAVPANSWYGISVTASMFFNYFKKRSQAHEGLIYVVMYYSRCILICLQRGKLKSRDTTCAKNNSRSSSRTTTTITCQQAYNHSALPSITPPV